MKCGLGIVRPFLLSSGVEPRCCSLPLQRRVVDFGADMPFHDVPKKLLEHYGFELCPEVVRKITLKHASRIESTIFESNSQRKSIPNKAGVAQLISEADGGMIPIVTIDNNVVVKDKRKTRKVAWKEARLCFSRDAQGVKAHFRATLKSTEVTGDIWYASAISAGLGNKTKVHCIGDGALWIKEQADRVFGCAGSYLTDFYHVSEYLGKVANNCKVNEAGAWLREQQAHLKRGDLYLVLQELERCLFFESGAENSVVRDCYRYLTNRLHQLNYLDAIMEELPIGSGEIESGHRHVVQKRMKRAGSWWKEENAEKMLQLLTMRANGLWEGYWDTQRDGFLEKAA